MKVTQDKYELPEVIADTVAELARLTNTNEKTIRSAISHVKSGRRQTSIYQEVDIEDGDE